MKTILHLKGVVLGVSNLDLEQDAQSVAAAGLLFCFWPCAETDMGIETGINIALYSIIIFFCKFYQSFRYADISFSLWEMGRVAFEP